MRGEKMMTNREKLIKTNIYDLLCEMQKNTGKRELSGLCVLELIIGKETACRTDNNFRINCRKCIQKWLAEEAQP